MYVPLVACTVVENIYTPGPWNFELTLTLSLNKMAFNIPDI